MNHSDLPKEWGNFIRQTLTDLCRTPVEISFRSLQKMNSDTFIEKKAQNRVFIRFGSDDGPFFIMEYNRGFLLFLLNRQLGFDLSFDECGSDDKNLSILDARSLGFLLGPISRFSDTFLENNDPLSLQILTDQSPLLHLGSEDCISMICECAAETSLSTISLMVPLRFLRETVREDLEREIDSTQDSDPTLEDDHFREISIKIGQTEIPLTNLSQLKSGDMISTSLLADTLFIVEVDGIPCFKGRPGLFEGKMAVELMGRIG